MTKDTHLILARECSSFQALTNDQQNKALQHYQQIVLERGMIQFGDDVQQQISDFSNTILGHIKQNQLLPTGTIMEELIMKLQQVEPDELMQKEKKWISKLFSKSGPSINELLSKYQKIGAQMEKISVRLRRSRESLLEDNERLEHLYQLNQSYYDELSILIAAGQIKLAEWKESILPAERAKLEHLNHDLSQQQISDLDLITEELEQRIYDLQISQQIAMQTAPQIRMIQKSNQTLADRIQSSILTTIPIWKHQIAIALSTYKQARIAQNDRRINRRTEELFHKTAHFYKTSSDIHLSGTLNDTQNEFKQRILETMEIEKTNQKNRQQVERSLSSIHSTPS